MNKTQLQAVVEISGKKFSNELKAYNDYVFFGGTDKDKIKQLWSNVQAALKDLHAAQVEFVK